MRKQLKQIKVWLSKKRVLLFVLIFSIAMPGISIFFLAQKSNLPYLALLIFIVPYLGILFFLLKAIDRTQKISEQLRIQKENYRVTLSSLGEGLITTNNQGQIVYMNPAAEKLTGWSWQDAKKRSLQNVFNVANEETGKPFENIVNRILKEGKGIEWENNTILSAKDSGTFIISNNGSPLLDSNGRITGAVLVFNDITEKKKNEKELKENEKQYSDLIQNLPEAVYTCDERGYIKIYNKAAVKLWGREPEAGKDLWCGSWKIFNTDGTDLPLDSCPMAICLKEGMPVHGKEIMVQRPDRSLRHVLPYPSPLFNAEGQLTGAINMLIDVTDKKEREILIQKTEERYRNLVEQASDAILIYSFDGTIHEFNKSCYTMLGYTAKEYAKLRLTDILVDEIVVNQDNYVAILAGETKTLYRYLMRKDGSLLETEVTVKMLADGKAIAFARDITERKKAEDALKQSEIFNRSILTSINYHIAVIEASGNIISVNKAWNDFSKENGESMLDRTGIGSNYIEVCKKSSAGGDKLAEKALNGFQQVIKKEIPFFEMEYPCHSLNKQRWFLLRIVNFSDGSSKIVMMHIDITERKKAEETIKKEKELSDSVINSLPGVFYFYDENLKLLRWNRQFENITGYSAEEISNMNPIEFFEGEDRKYMQERSRKVFASGSGDAEACFTTKAGKKIPFYFTGLRMQYEGKPSLLGIGIDITERKNTEAALIASEKEFRSLAESMPQIVWATRPDGWNIYFNQQWADYTGLTLEESYGHGWNKPFHPDDKQRAWDAWQNAVQNNAEYSLECRLRRYDGSYHWWLVRGIPQIRDSGEIVRWYGTCTDIEKIKQSEETIKESEEKYKLLFQSNPLPMWVLDLETFSFLAVNKVALKHYGYSEEEFLKLTALEIRPEEEIQRFLKDAEPKKNNLYNAGTWRHMKRDGSLINVQIFAYPFTYEGRKAELILVNDVTEKLAAEEKLRQSFEEIRELSGHLQNIREEERTHMAREIHDELGQQLTVMKMDVSWLNDKIGKTDKVVRKRTEELKDMLDKTVITVRRIASELRPSMLDDMGLGAAIEWHLSEFEKRSGVKTEFDKMLTELPLSDAVKTGLFRIVQESLTNVGRYANAKKVAVSLQYTDGQIVLAIKDDGIGFDKKKIAAKKTLGILGMKERTAMMGGTYNIYSTPGKGTMVAVKIPFEG